MSAIRQDVYIVNDSGGFSVMPSSALERIIADDRQNDHAIFPGWLVTELELSPELDPGHEKDWEDVKRAVAKGRLSIDTNELLVIGYLVHLRPFTSDAVLSPLPDDGWFEPETGMRVPARFPLGIPTDISAPDY